MKRMKNCIAILDDGVSKDVIEDLLFDYEVKPNGRIMTKKYTTDMFSHGTICAAIIRRYVPEAKVGSIKILNSEGIGNIKALLIALRWCAKHRIKIVNLSAGTNQMSDILPLSYEVKCFRKKGGILVAACKNGKNTGFPASFNGVIGVRASESLEDAEYIYDESPGGIEYVASGTHHLTFPRFGEFTTVASNSYAAPLISSCIYKELTGHKGKHGSGPNTLTTYIGCLSRNDNTLSEMANLTFSEAEVRPVVVCVGKKSSQLSNRIARRFLKEGYLPVVCAKNKVECYSEQLKIDSEKELNDKFQKLAVYCDADIIIASLGENSHVDSLHNNVFVCDASARMMYADGQKIKIAFPLVENFYAKLEKLIIE